jgi:hypothetical protein
MRNVATQYIPGPPGPPPITTLLTAFTMPAVGASTGALSLQSTAFFVVGQSVAVGIAGTMTVASLLGNNTATLTNPGVMGGAPVPGNAIAGASIPSGVAVGVSGPQGLGLFPTTSLTASFVQPLAGSNVTATVGTTAWMVATGYVTVATGGTYQVASITDATHVVLTNPVGIAGNATPGTTIASASALAPSGPISQGLPPSTTTSASFVQPAVNANVTVALVNTAWMVVGQTIVVATGGGYLVVSIGSSTSATLQNTGANGNATPGATVASGSGVGASGPTGQPGITQSPLIAAFVQPAIGSTVTANIATNWLAAGVTIVSAAGGTYTVQSITDATHAVLLNPASAVGNATPGTSIGINSLFALSGVTGLQGLQGPQGTQGIQGNTGATGPAPQSTLTTQFVQPASGGTVSANLGTAWMVGGEYVGAAGNTYLVQSVTDATHAVLVNPIAAIANQAPGTTIAATTLFYPTGAPGSPLGTATVGNTTTIENVVDWVTIAQGVTATLWTLPLPLVLTGESVELWCHVKIQSQSSTDTAQWTRSISVTNTTALGITTDLGTAIDTDLTAPVPPNNYGASLATATAQIVVASGTLSLKVTAPAGTAIIANGIISGFRDPLNALGTAPTVASVSVASGGSSGGNSTVITGTGFTNVSTILFGSFVVAPGNYTVNSSTQITVSSTPAGTGTGLTISVTTNNGTGSLASAWSYTVEPDAIFTGQIVGWWRNDGLQNSGTAVIACSDRTGNGHPMSVTGTVTYTASDATWSPAQPSAATDGVSGVMFLGPFPLTGGQASGGDAGVFTWSVYKAIGAPATGGVFSFWDQTGHNLVELLHLGGKPDCEGHNRGSATSGTIQTGNKILVWNFSAAGSEGASGINETSTSNGTPTSITGSGINPPSAGGTMTIGERANGASPLQLVWVESGLAYFTPGSANRPTTLQLSQLHSYAQNRYGVP